MTDADLQSEWLDLVDDVENGLIQRPEQQFGEQPEATDNSNPRG